MRACRCHQPQGPSTASRFAARAARMLRSATKKKLVKSTVKNPSAQEGRMRTPKRWMRNQKTPVT